ncbi:Flp family type IVb pilin [Arthrobacter sp. PAMC25284]|uniref:Flp family type IVb pilin n=1 Tax=Arthrobacter sp. PAMC25284 TaxID=2861279 RepID=UPI0021596BBB|nr:Flp family type IVb pilin [Arthrobacter sp. PAMC25284]
MNAALVSMMVFVSGIKTRLTDEEKGATAVEYGIMVALIAVVIIGAVTTFGGNLSSMFTNVAGKIPTTP